jgi:hypothetical protein
MPVLTLVLVLVVALVALIVINLVISPATQLPSIPAFQTLAPETSASVGDYQLEYHNNSLDLHNMLTQAVANIVQNYTSASLLPAYTSIQFQGRTYLLTRLASSGSSGAYWFKVIRLDRDQATDLTDPTDNPNLGLSCANPRFDGSALVFEMSLKCDAGVAVQDSSYQKYSIPLS